VLWVFGVFCCVRKKNFVDDSSVIIEAGNSSEQHFIYMYLGISVVLHAFVCLTIEETDCFSALDVQLWAFI
jgi:hypothetical protein